VEINTVDESDAGCLKYRAFLPPVQSIQIPMPVQVFMDRPIPFSCIFIKIRGIPIVLIKLPICKASQFSIKVEDKVENQEKHRKIQSHDWQVPTGEKVEGF
jgi:hypothetical protein